MAASENADPNLQDGLNLQLVNQGVVGLQLIGDLQGGRQQHPLYAVVRLHQNLLVPEIGQVGQRQRPGQGGL
jgi:hypothetical protein